MKIPFSHFVQARVAGESGAHANWGSQSWDWGANAEQYHVVELGKGMYHILCPDWCLPYATITPTMITKVCVLL